MINEIEDTLETKDLDMYYKDGAHEVNVYDNDKNPLPDIPVNITVNGITYYRITDDNGFAKLNINLDPGKYEILVGSSSDDIRLRKTIEIKK